MMKGKLFEDFMNRLLVSVGFDEVMADDKTIYMGQPGKMIQGLAQAHNADVLVQPTIQIPFYFPTRLLIECKDYTSKIGLNIIRSALGLRTDINSFVMIDSDMLNRRRSNHRQVLDYGIGDRYNYQVAVASTNGFTTQAQEFAYVHKIPLIDLKMEVFKDAILEYFDKIEKNYKKVRFEDIQKYLDNEYVDIPDADLLEEYRQVLLAISRESAVAITNSGDMIILHRIEKDPDDHCGLDFDRSSRFMLYWDEDSVDSGMWTLEYAGDKYAFMLPEEIFKKWTESSEDIVELNRSAISSKEKYFERLVVYYRDYDRNTHISVINIDKKMLKKAKERYDNE